MPPTLSQKPMSGSVQDWQSRIGRRLRLRDIHILSTVVQWGSMTKAASHLAMSQPAVSEAIADVEAALGVRLLDRTPQGVEPTLYASALLKRGLVVFDELRQGIKEIEFLADPTAGEVRIGCVESLAAGFVPEMIDQFSRKYPRVHVHVVNTQTATQEFRELRERTVDLSLGRILKPIADDEIDAEVLWQDEYFVVAGSRSPWARRRKIALADLLAEPWVFLSPNNAFAPLMAKAFSAQGLELPRAVVTSFSAVIRMQLVATGRFLTIVPGSLLRYNAERWDLKALPVALDAPSLPVAIFKLKHRTVSSVVEKFVEHLRAAAKSIAKPVRRAWERRDRAW
jgi:DNA-binding transcriptional LysR family regulator